jgi:hypothetical protein
MNIDICISRTVYRTLIPQQVSPQGLHASVLALRGAWK